MRMGRPHFTVVNHHSGAGVFIGVNRVRRTRCIHEPEDCRVTVVLGFHRHLGEIWNPCESFLLFYAFLSPNLLIYIFARVFLNVDSKNYI